MVSSIGSDHPHDHGFDTIAAIATAVAPGEGSVAIVRISGPGAEAIGQQLFVAPGRQSWESHRVLYGHVVDPASQQRVDEALLLLMRAPRSFTRETVVELHCHGGLVAVQRVLELVLAAGARRALPGEFTQRAFLNGRLDLTRAEAISEMVCSRSRRAAQLAMAGMDGGLQQQISGLRERLLDQLAELEARVDFEEDLPPLDPEQVVAEFTAVLGALEQFVGRPNVGKSSLLNLLSQRQRAIVTDLPGTTRDLLESQLVLEGVPLTLLDTAGIRPTDDRVEQLGIDRSLEALASADLVLLLFDLTAGWTPADQALRDLVPEGAALVLAGNKLDQWVGPKPTDPANDPADGRFSALTGEGRDALVALLLERCGVGPLEGLQVALNARQRDLAAAAAASLERSLEAAEQQLPWDFWTIDLRLAVYSLGEITGEEVSEAVLDRVFSRFCIGK